MRRQHAGSNVEIGTVSLLSQLGVRCTNDYVDPQQADSILGTMFVDDTELVSWLPNLTDSRKVFFDMQESFLLM